MKTIHTATWFATLGTNRVADFFSVVGSLALIVLIMVGAYYATRWYARRAGTTYGGKNIRIVDKAAVGNSASIVIACVEGRYLLLGVSDKNIQLLCELEDFQETETGTPTGMESFSSLMQSLLKKEKRTGGEHPEDGDGQ